jgi:hypothetical protein
MTTNERGTEAHTIEHGGNDDQLIMFLEPEQLVADKSRPVPRALLSARSDAALWALRVFVLVVTALVIYTFFAQLGS